MKALFSVAIALVIVAVVPADAARIDPTNKPCLKKYANWKKQAGHKAIAVSKMFPKGQACGTSWGMKNIPIAEDEAVRVCNGEVRQHYPKAKAGCVVIDSK